MSVSEVGAAEAVGWVAEAVAKTARAVWETVAKTADGMVEGVIAGKKAEAVAYKDMKNKLLELLRTAPVPSMQ